MPARDVEAALEERDRVQMDFLVRVLTMARTPRFVEELAERLLSEARSKEENHA